jgi:hypothetical protein
MSARLFAYRVVWKRAGQRRSCPCRNRFDSIKEAKAFARLIALPSDPPLGNDVVSVWIERVAVVR